MSHCFSIDENVDGKRESMCSVVPANAKLKKELEAREAMHNLRPKGTKVAPMRDLTATEIENAKDFFRKTKGANRTTPFHELQHITGQKNPDTGKIPGTPKKFFKPSGVPPPPPIGKKK